MPLRLRLGVGRVRRYRRHCIALALNAGGVILSGIATYFRVLEASLPGWPVMG